MSFAKHRLPNELIYELSYSIKQVTGFLVYLSTTDIPPFTPVNIRKKQQETCYKFPIFGVYLARRARARYDRMGDEHFVDRVITSRYDNGQLQLYIAWLGYPWEESSWENAAKFKVTAPLPYGIWLEKHRMNKLEFGYPTPIKAMWPTPTRRQRNLSGMRVDSESEEDSDSDWEPPTKKPKKIVKGKNLFGGNDGQKGGGKGGQKGGGKGGGKKGGSKGGKGGGRKGAEEGGPGGSEGKGKRAA